MRTKLLFAAITIFLITACTGTQVKISPEPSALGQSFNEPYASVGVRDIPAEKTLPVAGNLTEAFSNEIRSSGFSKEVYYPFRPNDETDITLDSQFNVEMDTHGGATFAKAFFTGLTLFILEPFFWYDFDYKLAGNVNVLKDGKVIKRVTAKTDATMSVKYLSLGGVASLEGETLGKAKKSLFRQLLNKCLSEVPTKTITTPEHSTLETPISTSTSQKLRELQGLKKDGLITEDEFQNKKKQLLDKL